MALTNISEATDSPENMIDVNRIANEVKSAEHESASSSAIAEVSASASSCLSNQICINEDDIGLDLTIVHNSDIVSNPLAYEFYQSNPVGESSTEAGQKVDEKQATQATSTIKSIKSENDQGQYSHLFQNSPNHKLNHLRQHSIDSSSASLLLGPNNETDLEDVSKLYNKMLINNNQMINGQIINKQIVTNLSESSLSFNSVSSTQFSDNVLSKRNVLEIMEVGEAQVWFNGKLTERKFSGK